MEKKQFQAESQRLLDLMINSIYTNKEIFLREVISNASDAIDKLAYKALTDDKVGLNRSDFKIRILPDKENSQLTISDNGIGMTAEELEKNLGTIARSGSFKFRKDVAEGSGVDEADVDVIGQFGVGFYSTFMVADHVTVISRAYGSDKAYQWDSDGVDGFTIQETTRDTVGTDVILNIKADTEEESYHQYLESYMIKHLVKRYSDYIRYPIECLMEKTRMKEKDPNAPEGEQQGWENYQEWEVLNSMIPLWNRPKEDVKDEEYTQFYQQNFGASGKPLTTMRVAAEGNVSYTALMFIPETASQEFYTRESKRGLRL